MPDFGWVQSPIFTPTSCCTCMTHRDPKGFVDLLVDNPVMGRLYMCATCIERAGKELRMLSREQGDDLTKRLKRAQDEILELHGNLEDEKANKVISLKDARKIFSASSGPKAAA